VPVRSTSTQGVEVVWNGVLVDTVTPASATWTTVTFDVVGTGGLDTLTIREVASQGTDGYGAMLDNFSLIANGTSQAALLTADDAAFLNTDPISDPQATFAAGAEFRGYRTPDETLFKLAAADAAHLTSFDTRHQSFRDADSTWRAGPDLAWGMRLGHELNSGLNGNRSDGGRHDRHAGDDPVPALHQAPHDLATLLGAHPHLGDYGLS